MSADLGVNGRGWRLASAITLGLLLTAAPLIAQQTGTILGVVRDASGAVVPDAKITVTNVDTNDVRTATTSGDGVYRVPALRPGNYSVRVEKEGFKISNATDLNLNVAQELVVNRNLEVGSSTQEVTVTGEAPLVNTSSSTTGSLVDETQMSDLPLNGRNYVDLTLIQPGVQLNFISGGAGGGVAGVFFSSNGAGIRSNNFTLDGASLLNTFGGGTSSQAGTTLGIDGIKEYKVVTHSFSAEYGMFMGSHAVMVSKGGSNRWSGDVFEYLRNSALDARNFFDTPVPGGRRLPLFQRNNFGGAFGGPIKKDKTFFFAVYEGLRENLGVTLSATVLPSACHDLVPIGNGGTTTGLKTVRGDADATGDPNDVTGQLVAPFPGGANLANPGACATGLTNTSVVPSSVQSFIGQWPIVAANSLGQFIFPGKGTSTVREDYGQIRVDHIFSVEDTMFARYTFDDSDLFNETNSSAVLPTGNALPQWGVTAGSRNQFLTVGETHIFSPAVLNQFRLSYSRTNLHGDRAVLTTFLNPWGQLVGPQWSLTQDVDGTPLPLGNVSVSGLTTLGGNNIFPAYHILNVGTISDDVFYTHGRHAFKFGVLLNRFANPTFIDFQRKGSVSFNSIATFMTGISNTYRAVTPYPGHEADFFLDRDYTYNTLGFYVQDDFRMTQRLTWNLGLRYEIMTNLSELNNRQSFLPDTQTSSTFAFGPIMNNYTLKNWSPRLGFAWDVRGNGRTALRGGVGLYYDVGNLGAVLIAEPLGMPPYAVQNQVQANPNPITLPLTLNDLSNPRNLKAAVIQGVDNNIRQLYSIQESLTFEQQLPFDIGLSVGYVGTRGVHLWDLQEGNPCEPLSVVNGVYSWANAGNLICPGIDPGTGLLAQNFGRTNPTFSSAVWYTSPSQSWYHALQIVVNKSLSHGLEVQSSYTWSHSIDYTQGQQRAVDCTGSGMTPPQNPANLAVEDKGPSCFDVRNAFRLSALYRFPGINSNSFVSKITNGWWLGSIVTIQGGNPFTPVISNNRSLDGNFGGQNGDRPDFVTDAVTKTIGGKTFNFVPFNPDTVITGDPNQWFNPLMFQLGPVGVHGNVPRGLLRGPDLKNWDISVNKDTALGMLGERGKIQFRAEFFNVLNRANFGFPSGTVFPGNTNVPAGPNQAPIASTGLIQTTLGTSRQIQLALKVIF